MRTEYSDCYFCGGEVTEKRISREVWRGGSLCVIEDVPVGVCRQCGEKTILPEVARRIDALLAGKALPDHFVQVPTYSFGEAELAR